jgi:hypothetical protein
MSEQNKREILQQLIAGVPADVILTDLERCGTDTHEAVYAINTLHLARRATLRSQEISKAHAYWMTGVLRRLAATSAQTIDVADAVSSSEFLADYYVANQPLLLRGTPPNICAGIEASIAAIATIYGETMLTMSSESCTPSTARDPDFGSPRCQAPLRDFLDRITSDASTSYRTIAGSEHPWMSIPVKFSAVRMIVPQDSGSGRLAMRLDPANAASALRDEPRNAFLLQLVGRRRFVLFPPHDHVFLHAQEPGKSVADPCVPDVHKHPLLRHASAREVVLEPGDALFVPVAWPHYVECLEANVSLICDTFDVPNRFYDEAF